MTLGPHTLGWAFTFLLCFALFNGAWGDCGPPPDKPNTNPIKERSGTTGQTFDYECDRSNSYYEIPGKSKTITCQADDTWTNIEDFCSRACGLPKRISYAAPKSGALNQNIFLPNATVSYDCRPGYTPVHGKKSLLTCLEDYTWSEPEVFCQRRSCENPGKVENGNMEATDFLFGSRVTYACNEGYRLVKEPNFRDCQANGIWSNSLPKCDAVKCPAPELPADGKYHPQKDEYNYLDYVIFSCQKPLQVVGNASISCTATGKWSLDSPTCKATCKENFHIPHFASLNETSTIYYNGTVVRFKCKPGFTRNEKENTITCRDHSWSGHKEFCTRISCGDPGKIKNGNVLPSDYLFGSIAIYTCEKGYVMNTTQNFTECQANGTWSTAIGCKERETYGDGEQKDKPKECETCSDMEQGDEPEDASKSEGIGIGGIVGICCGIIIIPGVAACVGYLLYRKKRKTGKLHPQIPSVQYSHCTAINT